MKLAKSYEAALYEADIYALWEKSNAFSPSGKGQPFSLVAPPPNANGNLHLGHALTFALEDMMARYHRAKGENVLYVPGADHAGFETQVVYERELEKQGKSRFDYSRKELYDQIYSFVAQNKDHYQNQIRRLGASVDWTRFTFSLDEPIIKQAYATFRAMLEKGLIYRGERLVNFCTFHGTAFADIEVDYREEQGKLWRIKYPLADGSGSVEVATTRPETMLGDSAIAVNPKDPRYRSMVGKTIKLPLTNREIPLIADSYVDTKFGTGALKVTPAHDPNDYDIAKRHDLPFVSVIGFDGKLNHEVPQPFRGLSVEQGREAVLEALKERGYLVGDEDLTHSVGHCYKCGNVIEPLLKEQWFIDIKPLAAKAVAEIRTGKIDFIPKSKKSQLETYFANIKDWNISRQIVWGIPIPAFQNEEDPGDWIFDERVDAEVIEVNHKTYRRDPDVFDTWFSSSSWPYATLGYPEGDDFRSFYPLSVMESGSDLLLPWISRMIMLGLYVTGDIPFRSVYLHGMITDAKGKKMSKSVGNVIEPMSLVDKYGSDALRIGLISGHGAGSNQPFSEAKVIGGRNFTNKLWNVARFIEDRQNQIDSAAHNDLSPADNWILYQYELCKNSYSDQMDKNRFSEAYATLYHFIWDDLADWYIEASKINTNPDLALKLLKATLVLAHPFMPFLSETIWQTLELDPDSLLSSQLFLALDQPNRKQAQHFETLIRLISAVRSLIKATGAKDVKLYHRQEALVVEFSPYITRLSGVKSIEEGEPGQGILITEVNLNVWLNIERKQIDNYLVRLEEQIKSERALIDQLEKRLNNASYVNQAPPDLVNQSRDQLVEAEQRLENLLSEKERFSKF